MDTTAQNLTNSTLDPFPLVTNTTNQSGNTEALEDQNIFVLLGVQDGTEDEKESFLDELQQVIWEDFLENDVKVLLTTDELQELTALLGQTYANETEKQEKAVAYLEKLIPDLEEIMLEKALELKSDLFGERIMGMKEFFVGQADKVAKVEEAQVMMQQDKWASAAQILNGLK